MPKISQLTATTTSDINPEADFVAVVDTSAATTKKVLVSDAVAAGLSGVCELTANGQISGGLTRNFEFNDIATLTLDATNLNLSGVAAASLASTGAGAGQGEVEIRADQQLTILTPAVVAQTATVGQVLQLTDAVNGVVEFASAGGLTGTIISPSANGLLNNWNPAGLATANVIRITSAQTVGLSVTGIAAKNDGDFLFLINASQYACEFYFQSASSLVTNRIAGSPDYATSLPATLAICPGQTAVFIYNSYGGQAQWIHLGNIGDGVWDVRRIPGNATIGLSGSFNANRKFTRITSAATSIKGITALLDAVSGSTPYIWNEITAWNVSGASITIEHESVGATAINRIVTPSSANVTWPDKTEARFVYDATESRWRLTHASF